MRVDDLLKPVSADAPCGEDLLAVDDPDFIDYYFNVEDRLPTSYFNILRGELFDARTVDQKGETAQIDALLKRSRDIRLLVLEAKFQILAGRFKGFAEAISAIAALIEAWPEALHPTESLDRRNALEELDSLATIAAPLEHATLLTDRRIGDITLRAYATGSGKATAREGEASGDATAISGALGSSDNAAAVDALYAQITGLQTALSRVAAVTRSGASPFTPTLKRLDERLADIAAMITAARSDLGGTVTEPPPPAGADDGAATATPVQAGGTTTIIVQTSVGDIPDHHIAYRLLATVEAYFARHEPASLALVLVTQSRLLIGRPLVDALDALLPNESSTAKISFGTDQGFGIHMGRMRDLMSYAGLPDSSDYAGEREGDPPMPEIASRDHAGQILKQVEDFFRIREPASPIPILLFKARNMLAKDFHALVRELIPDNNSY